MFLYVYVQGSLLFPEPKDGLSFARYVFSKFNSVQFPKHVLYSVSFGH